MPIYKKLSHEALAVNPRCAVVLPIPDDASKELLIKIYNLGCEFHVFADEALDSALEVSGTTGRYPEAEDAEKSLCCERWNLAQHRLNALDLYLDHSSNTWIPYESLTGLNREYARKQWWDYVKAHPFRVAADLFLRTWLGGFLRSLPPVLWFIHLSHFPASMRETRKDWPWL